MQNRTLPQTADLVEKTHTYLQKLCIDIPTRQVGTAGNRAATDFLATQMASCGFHVDCPQFDCINWIDDGAQLTVNGTSFEAQVSPYSLGGQARGPLVALSTVGALAAADLSNRIVLLSGDLTREQLMPKNFPFYNPEHHRQIYHLLETKQPLAIIAATAKDEALAGALYPFPLIEDGDFDIPSVFMTDVEGERLAACAGQEASLDINATRIPATACNVIARTGIDAARRVVVTAHIDAKFGTPGALDNATGVIVLMLLAELLAGYSGNLGIDLVTFNSEDYYSAAGEILYVAQNEGRFGEMLLNINIDLMGYRAGHSAYSLYECPEPLDKIIRATFAAQPDMIEGDPWYQSDHGLFLQQQVPAIAIASERMSDIMSDIAHTPKDRPELVSAERVVGVALALHSLLTNGLSNI